MGAWHKRQLAMFTVQLKNGETIQVSVEELEEFLKKIAMPKAVRFATFA